jgi:hypothetical protein
MSLWQNRPKCSPTRSFVKNNTHIFWTKWTKWTVTFKKLPKEKNRSIRGNSPNQVPNESAMNQQRLQR